MDGSWKWPNSNISSTVRQIVSISPENDTTILYGAIEINFISTAPEEMQLFVEDSEFVNCEAGVAAVEEESDGRGGVIALSLKTPFLSTNISIVDSTFERNR